MDDFKARQLLQEIVTKTRAGRIKWEPTANESEYFCVLPGGFLVSVRSWQDHDTQGNWSESRGLALRTGEKELKLVTCGFTDPGWVDLGDILDLARRQAVEVDAEVDRLLGELAKL